MTRSGAGPRLAYLALEAPVEGQAAHTHVHEMIRGLEGLGWTVERFLAERSGAAAGGSLLTKLRDYASVQRRLLVRLEQVDAVYVRGHFMAWPIVEAAALRRVPVFHEINGVHADVTVTYPWTRRLRPLIERLQRRQYRLAAGLFAVTPGLVAWARAESRGRPAHLVPNAANTALFEVSGPAADLGAPYVLFVGGLAKWHGIATMLAASREPGWPAGVRLAIAGDGIERDLLAREESDPATPLLWLRRRPQAEVPALLRGALAALVPIEDPGGRSGTGVLPLKLYESMACGTPVIATELPGQAELVREEDVGIVVPVGDAAALAGAVAALAGDTGLREAFGSRAAAAARARHDWRHRAASVDRLIRAALG